MKLSTNNKRIIIFLAGCLAMGIAKGQVNSAIVQQVLEKEIEQNTMSLNYPLEIREFYKLYQYNPAWITQKSMPGQLLDNIGNAGEFGLNKEDYQFDLIKLTYNNQISWYTPTDSVKTDFRITDAAIHFFREVAWGAKSPIISYNGLQYTPDSYNIPDLLAMALLSGQISNLVQQLECKSPEYIALKNKILLYNRIIADSSFQKNIPITSALVNSTNRLLVRKLYQLGLIESPEIKLSEKVLKGKVKEAQRLFSLLDDGVLRSTAMQELNVSITERVKELYNALNTLGLIKFGFYNPFGGYLHDTPWKELFDFNKRYFSHGCMRVEKATELAHLILKENSIALDTLLEKGCLLDQPPVTITSGEKMPLFVLYNTAWVDSAATVRFYENIYRK